MSTRLQIKQKNLATPGPWSVPAQAGLLGRKHALGGGFGQSFVSQPSLLPAQRTTSCPVSPRRCPFGGVCHSCPVGLQTKLAMSQPDDEYEREADRVAEMVMQMPEPTEGKEYHQPGDAQTAQRQATNMATLNAVPPIVHEVLRSPGQPLGSRTRANLESRLGHDFSGVRVHMDAKAAASAQAMQAQAYTSGSDIVFGYGNYDPSSKSGTGLLAHELVHVIQQSFSSGAAGCGQQGVVQRRGQSDPSASQAQLALQFAPSVESLEDVQKARTYIHDYYSQRRDVIDVFYDEWELAIRDYDLHTRHEHVPRFDLLDLLDVLGSVFKAVRALRPLLVTSRLPSAVLPHERIFVPRLGAYGTVIQPETLTAVQAPLSQAGAVGVAVAEGVSAAQKARGKAGPATTAQETTVSLASEEGRTALDRKVDMLYRSRVEENFFADLLEAVKRDPQYQGRLYDVLKASVGELPDLYGEEILRLKGASKAIELYLYKKRFGSGAGLRCVRVVPFPFGERLSIEGSGWTSEVQHRIAKLLGREQQDDREQISAICECLGLPVHTAYDYYSQPLPFQ